MIITNPGAAAASEQARAGRDPRTFWRVAVALALPVGPLLVTVARAILPYWTSDDADGIVAGIAAHPERMEVLSWVGLLVVPFMLITVLGLGYVARRGSPVLATIGAIPAFFAYGMWNATGGGDYLAWVMSTNGYSRAEMVRLGGLLESTPMATVSGFFWVFVHILGMVIAAIALHRARVLPRWAAILLALSQPIHLVAAVIVPSRWLDVFLGWGLTTFVCGYVALRVLRMSNEEWDLPVRRPDR
jgi:hypothetical protein